MRRYVLALALLLSACARAPLPVQDAAGDAGPDAGALLYCGQDQDCPCGQRCIGGACAPMETR